MKIRKTVYYNDPVNDDFAGNNICTNHVGEDFPFAPASRLWRLGSNLLYYAVAAPLVWVISKFWLGLKIENRSAIKKIGKGGCFLYGNHTQFIDAFVPPLSSFPKRAYTICNPDAVSIKGLAWAVQMLGGIPLPTEHHAMVPFMKGMEQRLKEGAAIAIYPEAHIWPYYTGIRPFPSTSFRYPAKYGCPAFAMVGCYRKRKGLFALSGRPGMTVYIEGPFYPDPSLPDKEAGKKLREEIYSCMTRIVAEKGSVSHIEYIQNT